MINTLKTWLGTVFGAIPFYLLFTLLNWSFQPKEWYLAYNIAFGLIVICLFIIGIASKVSEELKKEVIDKTNKNKDM